MVFIDVQFCEYIFTQALQVILCGGGECAPGVFGQCIRV